MTVRNVNDPPTNEPAALRALIAVGASAGGVSALQDFVAGLPGDLPAAVLVVLHLPPRSASSLATILDRAGPLPVTPAVHGGALEAGRIYTAVPDHHLLAVDTHAALSRGPTENGSRPAVDALFRSVALEYGPRSIGVVLSGALDDGTAGIAAIKSRGGMAIVQDPGEAAYRGMPESAMSHVRVDHVLRVGDMGAVLTDRLNEPVSAWPQTPGPRIDELEARLARAATPDLVGTTEVTRVAVPSGFRCPDCDGGLFTLDAEGRRYRCRIGHAWTSQALLYEQGAEFERALWAALRALEEKRDLAEHMRTGAREGGRPRMADRYSEHVDEAAHAANVLRRMLFDGVGQPGELPSGDA
jgi:two-component system chemotaxis response regulator CheB